MYVHSLSTITIVLWQNIIQLLVSHRRCFTLFSGALWGFSTIVEAQGVMGRTKMTASDVSIYVDHSVVSSKKISWTLPKMNTILTSSEDFDQDSHFRVNRLDVVQVRRSYVYISIYTKTGFVLFSALQNSITFHDFFHDLSSFP